MEKQMSELDGISFFDFINLHNAVSLGNKSQEEFNSFVLDNKDKFDNLEYLQVFGDQVEPKGEYYKANFEMCKVFYDFMESNPEWVNFSFGLRTRITLGMFHVSFEKYLAGGEVNV